MYHPQTVHTCEQREIIRMKQVQVTEATNLFNHPRISIIQFHVFKVLFNIVLGLDLASFF